MPEQTQGQFDQIPIIDLAPLFDGSEGGIERVAQAIDAAYSQVGFAYLINHGIEQTLIDQLFDASRQFHALPRASKMQIEVNKHHRGFIPINTSTTRTSSVAKVTKPNQSESFMMMHELADDDPDMVAGVPLAGPNQWPRNYLNFALSFLATTAGSPA